jgi:hypothetical protein
MLERRAAGGAIEWKAALNPPVISQSKYVAGP